MSDLFDQTIAKVKQLPAAEQDAAAYLLIDYLETKRGTLLTDEQLAEVRRRRSDPNAVWVSHEEARQFIDRLISR
ncbi:hypothetical protein [Tardiphaga sp.]|jgi:hypothetical protein|uniref:hypothetical protein n=1 Tax=Tardiphaga sp. TaxID=1926292 RepID=UPI0037D9F3E1